MAVSDVLTVETRGIEVLGVLRNGGKRMAFALVNALNKSIRDVQRAEQDAVFKEFTVRRPTFVRREAGVISKRAGGGFASVGRGRYEAAIRVGEKARLLLSAFEEGGDRREAMADTGFTPKGKRAAMPVIGGPARPTFAAQVPSALQFSQLRLRPASKSIGKGKARIGGAAQYRGQQRTFTIRGKAGKASGVWQRVGKGDIRPVYFYESAQKLPKSLGWIPRARKVGSEAFPRHLSAEIRAAFAFAASRAMAA